MKINTINNTIKPNQVADKKSIQAFEGNITPKIVNSVKQRQAMGVFNKIATIFRLVRNRNFNIADSYRIAKNLKEDDSELLTSLLNAKDMFNNRRYNAKEISKILEINEDSAYTKELIEAEYLVPDYKQNKMIKIGLPYFNNNDSFIKSLENHYKNKNRTVNI